jgi:hypothetical protein
MVSRRCECGDVDTDPIDTLKHPDAEVKAAYVYRICLFPFPGSHLRKRFRPTHRTGSSSRGSVDRRVGVVIHEFILWDRPSRAHNDGREGKKTDDDFIVVISITEFMYNLDDDTDEIALARRQGAQHIETSSDEP